MPTYEYECLKCGKRFEVFQKMTDEPKKRCPTCRGKVRRLIGAGAGMIFKGSGFYITDYRSKSYKEQQKKESGAPAPAKEHVSLRGLAAGESSPGRSFCRCHSAWGIGLRPICAAPSGNRLVPSLVALGYVGVVSMGRRTVRVRIS